MDKKIIPIISILSGFGVLFMLNYTSPLSAGVLGVLIFFTMVFTMFFGIATEVVKVVQKILKAKRGRGGEEKFRGDNRTYAYAAILTFAPMILLLMLRTHGEVQISAWVGVAAVIILGCFWVYKKA